MSDLVVEIIRRGNGEYVEATLRNDMRPEDLIAVEEMWRSARDDLREKLAKLPVAPDEWPESLHWDWSKKARELRLLEATGFGIIYEGSWEGVMLTKTTSYLSRLLEDKGKPLVYVDYLEIAPWNWPIPRLGQEGRYRAVGSLLFREAVKQSIEEEFHGRVGLHALPQAEGFYETACGMEAIGPDPDKHDLIYFELSRKKARELLDENGGAA